MLEAWSSSQFCVVPLDDAPHAARRAHASILRPAAALPVAARVGALPEFLPAPAYNSILAPGGAAIQLEILARVADEQRRYRHASAKRSAGSGGMTMNTVASASAIMQSARVPWTTRWRGSPASRCADR